jgi:ATP-dependent RNA helicase SUPV3L1/SUV3
VITPVPADANTSLAPTNDSALTEGIAPVAASELSTEVAMPETPAVSAEATPPADGNGAAEPEMIEVWRPGRPEGRPHHRRTEERPERRRPRAASAQPAAPVEGAEVAAAPAPEESRGPRRRDRGNQDDRGENREQQGRERTGDRPPRRNDRDKGRDRNERNRPDRDRDRNRRDRGERGPDRLYASSEAPRKERRDKAPDPNSPFAKLAALKEQLESSKDRH